MWQGIEHRRFPRAQYQCIVHLRQHGKEVSFSALTENIGVGGVCVLLEQSLDVFAPVELEITLTAGKPALRVQGTVVWVVRRRELKGAKFDTGVEFIQLSSADKARLEAIVDQVAHRA